MKVLFVCTANICRSAYAEVVARCLAQEALTFSSAGVHGRVSEPMESLMAAEAEARGALTSAFRSRRLALQMVDEADLILTAESGHRLLIIEERPLAMRNTFSLGQFARGLSALDGGHQDLLNRVRAMAATSTAADDVADPYRRGGAAAATAALELDRLLGRILPALSQASR